jgi:hypothetical protein
MRTVSNSYESLALSQSRARGTHSEQRPRRGPTTPLIQKPVTELNPVHSKPLHISTWSRASSVGMTTAMGYTTEESGFDSQQGQKIVVSSTASRPALRPTKLPI